MVLNESVEMSINLQIYASSGEEGVWAYRLPRQTWWVY